MTRRASNGMGQEVNQRDHRRHVRSCIKARPFPPQGRPSLRAPDHASSLIYSDTNEYNVDAQRRAVTVPTHTCPRLYLYGLKYLKECPSVRVDYCTEGAACVPGRYE